MKVTQLCLTLCDPTHYTVHGILQARILEWVAFPFSREVFPIQGSNSDFSHCRWILYQPQGKPVLDFRTKLKKGGGHWQVKETVLAILPHQQRDHRLRMRNGQRTTRHCRVIRDPEWMCIVFRKVELIRLKEENETQVSYTIFTPHCCFLQKWRMSQKTCYLYSIFFPWDSALIAMDRRFENCDFPALLLALNFMNS